MKANDCGSESLDRRETSEESGLPSDPRKKKNKKNKQQKREEEEEEEEKEEQEEETLQKEEVFVC